CATTTTMSVTVNSNITPTFTALGPYCVGAAPGALSTTSTNGITGTWSPATISTATAGTTVYTFTPTAGQCATTTTMTVIVDISFTPSFINPGPYCLGDTPSLLSTTSTNGITGSWSPATISTLVAGTTNYTFTPDAGQCAVDISLPITVNQLPSLNLTGTDPLCFGESSGYITASASGGTPDYSLTWAGGTYTMTGGNHSIVALGSGNYDFTVTDANNCTNTASQTLSDPAILGISVTYTPITVFGGTSTVTVSASGGTPGYTGTGIFTVFAGTYTYTVYDANNCESTQTITITQPAQLLISVTATPISCFGETSTITVSASGGTPPYSGTGIFNEVAGTYTYTVSDAAGSSDSETITLAQPSEIFISETILEDTVCFGEFGTATISVSGGVGAYSIQWQNGTIDFTNFQIITNINFGYTVTDNNGCTAQDSVFVYSSDELLVSYTGSDETCFNSNDANITVSNLSGGTEPYYFAWSNGSEFPSLYGVDAGTYRVTVSDIYGCSTTDEITVNQPAEIVLTLSSTDANCNGITGTATASVSGGTLPISYNWSNFEDSSFIDGLNPGIYSLTIIDASSCTLSQDIEIGINGNLNPTINIVNPISCYGDNDGVLEVVCNEAVLPCNYLWNNGTINQQNSGLTNGEYSVSLIDSRGCEGSASAILIQPTQITVTEIIHNPSCHNTEDGTISLNISGGTAPYSGMWDNSETGMSIGELLGGTYSVTVTDSRNCKVNETYSLTQPSAIILDYQKTDILCYGDANGSIIMSASGGSGSFSFGLEHNEITFGGSNHYNLNGGYYTAFVNDNNGCSQSTDIIISEPGLLDISFTSGNPSCRGMNDGYILAEATGGVAPYIFLFNGFYSDIPLIANLKDGEYELIVTDSNNCKTEAGIVYLNEMDIDCIRIPNAFTPNADGINDTWIIENILYFPDSYIQVFNRWGQEIYNAKAEAGDWDGTYNDKFVPAGTYLYVIKLHNGTEAYTGMVSVVY
ncbi:MAG: gliding motility-associated C-terminal domain-containing protein, partial [Bacteroidales bacterium]|nr:gliding motility-associated C-terminal domain-containing protein [Bacteroidales bacterium]